ncbi:transporter suffix domain-containing protein [soil metagenome]
MTPDPKQPKNWRYYVGLTALVLSVVFPLSAFLVPLLRLSSGAAALTSGFLLAGAPEILILLAVALLGKENFDLIISRAKGFFFVTFFQRPTSKFRYSIGLTIFILSILPLYLMGYASSWMPTGNAKLFLLGGADLACIASVFVMGGEFWGKFRSLFVWEGSTAMDRPPGRKV